MALRHVEANMDVTLSNLTSILPRPKFGKQGVPVVKMRNCFRVSGMQFAKILLDTPE